MVLNVMCYFFLRHGVYTICSRVLKMTVISTQRAVMHVYH